ncbi:aspartyl protease family protein [Arundinibacter roseus]|uniref:PDZ domain-containing protein n=1 Tax=Arundinibacter roseus TaxID=2070510 RepID=A0A4V2X9G4_9BACT|nr:aspartyl protease family protein [Arundinibacter roseus]TDB63645.1 PDZ domain-containing protein [Arundinibacter roseus]
MKLTFLFVFFVFCSVCALESIAQSKIFGFHLTDKRRSVKVPFELHANLIIVPAQINGSDTLRFILDTGVSSTIITDPSVSRFINTDYVRSVRLEGVGKDSIVEAKISIGNTLRIGFAQTYDHNMVVLQEDILKLSEIVGTSVHGIIGYELFERFVVAIDFRNRELLIRTPGQYKYRKRDGHKIPIQVVDKKPYIEDVYIREVEKEQKVKLLLDTGAGHAVMLNTFANSIEIPLPETLIDVQLGIGLSGKISGYMGRLDEVRIGSYNLTQVVTSFPDSASFGSKIRSEEERQGNIGGELLRRFKVTINYPEQFITMKPIKRMLKETFEHDMSGMDLRARGANFNEYYVDRIIEDSPAFYAGLQKDDRVIFINNVPANTLSMTEIYKLLQRKEGKEINIIVNRNGKIIFTSVILKRII